MDDFLVAGDALLGGAVLGRPAVRRDLRAIGTPIQAVVPEMAYRLEHRISAEASD